jgi:hypothetical protein
MQNLIMLGSTENEKYPAENTRDQSTGGLVQFDLVLEGNGQVSNNEKGYQHGE